MNTELTIPENEQPIVMRSGLTHFVKSETAEKIRSLLASQSGHSFMNISELKITINTADISGVYTKEEYADLVKVKQGMWQCEYRKWHLKKGECQCKEEADAEHKRKMEVGKKLEDERPRTPEEKATIARALAFNREILEKKGIIKTKFHTGYVLKRSAINGYEKRFGNKYRIPPGTEIVEDVEELTTTL